ncbi:MAG TPA: phage holin family protein [Novimethylophilus sp.]|jgi:uncharacterized membrane protein YqjE|uniref:phage holin family protein n=1 Tax=Novimethylophilus sp. TaxID=2137426 RepID=UPI002F40D86E
MVQSSGLFTSIKTLLGTLLGVTQTRLELLATEIEEERLRLTRLLLYGFFALFFFGLGVLLLSVLVIAAFWDSHRLAAIAAVAVMHLGIAFVCAVCLRQQAKHKPRLFSASLAELGKDRAALASRE